MKRKSFIRSSIGALTASYLPAIPKFSASEDETLFVSPVFLKPGDLIGITAPAGYITTGEIRSAVQKMESWGYKIHVGETIDKRDFTFGGSDEERTKDFQQMLDDPKVKAIMCARGGYGVVRIIDNLNWEKFKTKPKWIIGFSDVTVFHSHLNKNFGIASIHSKMCNSFPDDWSLAEPMQIETIESIQLALSGKKMKYSAISNQQNKLGTADGVLIGGNLKMLETLAGTRSDINTAGKILFVEDTGEYMYSIDRMFWNLKRTGKLSQLKGLIVGGFKIKVDEDSDDFGKTLQDVVLEKVKACQYPVCFDFPVGHQKNNYALKCGVRHRLDVSPDNVILKEI
jgi:muramoyltetrapeptide carboxypeptidase